MCGFHILGHSGVIHEIDNIAWKIKDDIRFFFECKTGEIDVKTIFIFSGKIIDIGCNRGYIFTANGKN